MPGPQYTSKAQGLQPFDVDTITITRYASNVVNLKVDSVPTVIWTGTADFQKANGQVYYNAAGAVEEAEAICIIDTAPLPTVKVGDVVFNGTESFLVAAWSVSTYALSFLRLMLKRGDVPFHQK